MTALSSVGEDCREPSSLLSRSLQTGLPAGLLRRRRDRQLEFCVRARLLRLKGTGRENTANSARQNTERDIQTRRVELTITLPAQNVRWGTAIAVLRSVEVRAGFPSPTLLRGSGAALLIPLCSNVNLFAYRRFQVLFHRNDGVPGFLRKRRSIRRHSSAQLVESPSTGSKRKGWLLMGKSVRG